MSITHNTKRLLGKSGRLLCYSLVGCGAMCLIFIFSQLSTHFIRAIIGGSRPEFGGLTWRDGNAHCFEASDTCIGVRDSVVDDDGDGATDWWQVAIAPAQRLRAVYWVEDTDADGRPDSFSFGVGDETCQMLVEPIDVGGDLSRDGAKITVPDTLEDNHYFVYLDHDRDGFLDTLKEYRGEENISCELRFQNLWRPGRWNEDSGNFEVLNEDGETSPVIFLEGTWSLS